MNRFLELYLRSLARGNLKNARKNSVQGGNSHITALRYA
ncbi:hypothetical protein COLO4_11533 [Corchorus olitorius]|uniref:Uncharacterized protein n=1 Tax=Corchorus olitorius TaxID=93759 RepID=A0A1R3K420_9ROSI|nr:hypothetical protein COLO4_11533 [Corchorus olitorius]